MPDDDPPIVLSADALTRRFGPHTVVDRVSLSVARGEVFGLLGRNGAGKSTLIKMLTTLLPPSSGSARIEGFDIRSQATRVRALVGYVPQALSADGELTGYENLLVFARLYELPRAVRTQRIEEALAFMGLDDAAHRLVATYSGGMIRRLEIAQSMLHRPRLLFLDEPTVGLDPVARETVWQHIRRLRERFDTTIFMTTHYMDEAEALCGRFGILRAGALVACGRLDELRAASGLPAATLDQLFAHYTGAAQEAVDAYAETSAERRTSRRLA
ncbi:ABC transporter ATP-binding protein [Aquabacterium sp.]|uniref:ABC transporter ATP-binding protein n=1 Tax=Aquabacterium sp. TaxID=1872578 RepID=UPI0037849F02